MIQSASGFDNLVLFHSQLYVGRLIISNHFKYAINTTSCPPGFLPLFSFSFFFSDFFNKSSDGGFDEVLLSRSLLSFSFSISCLRCSITSCCVNIISTSSFVDNWLNFSLFSVEVFWLILTSTLPKLFFFFNQYLNPYAESNFPILLIPLWTVAYF